MARRVRNPFRPGTTSHEAFRRGLLERRQRAAEIAAARAKTPAKRSRQLARARSLRRELRVLPAREAASRRRAEIRRAEREGHVVPPLQPAPAMTSLPPAEALRVLRLELTPHQRSRLDSLPRTRQLDLADLFRRYPAGPPPKPGTRDGVDLGLSGLEWWIWYRALGFPRGRS